LFNLTLHLHVLSDGVDMVKSFVLVTQSRYYFLVEYYL